MVFLSSELFSRSRNTPVPYKNIFLAPKNSHAQDFSSVNSVVETLSVTRKPPVGDAFCPTTWHSYEKEVIDKVAQDIQNFLK